MSARDAGAEPSSGSARVLDLGAGAPAASHLHFRRCPPLSSCPIPFLYITSVPYYIRTPTRYQQAAAADHGAAQPAAPHLQRRPPDRWAPLPRLLPLARAALLSGAVVSPVASAVRASGLAVPCRGACTCQQPHVTTSLYTRTHTHIHLTQPTQPKHTAADDLRLPEHLESEMAPLTGVMGAGLLVRGHALLTTSTPAPAHGAAMPRSRWTPPNPNQPPIFGNLLRSHAVNTRSLSPLLIVSERRRGGAGGRQPGGAQRGVLHLPRQLRRPRVHALLPLVLQVRSRDASPCVWGVGGGWECWAWRLPCVPDAAEVAAASSQRLGRRPL